MNFLEAATSEERLSMMKVFAKKFFERSTKLDEEGNFPFDNIHELVESGYTTLTVPKKYGGKEISLLEFVQLQEQIAIGDGATALSIGWHLGIIKNLGEKELWEEALFQWFCEKVKKGALTNGAASERATGSPTRGGKPQTTAELRENQWIINGRKIFTTMAPVLNYFIVSASIKGRDEVGNFLIPREAEGVKIEETWDSIAMRGTGSHDLVLTNVEIDEKYLVEIIQPGNKAANGWLLHIPACYLGIAQAAQNYSIQFAREYAPNSLNGPIIELPNVKQKIGEMEKELLVARSFLYAVARQWDDASEYERPKMKPELSAAKLVVTNAAIHVVDLAMRLVGASSLSQKSPLQRYYRDVRAGLHNPPMDDMTIMQLAQAAIEKNN